MCFYEPSRLYHSMNPMSSCSSQNVAPGSGCYKVVPQSSIKRRLVHGPLWPQMLFQLTFSSSEECENRPLYKPFVTVSKQGHGSTAAGVRQRMLENRTAIICIHLKLWCTCKHPHISFPFFNYTSFRAGAGWYRFEVKMVKRKDF